MDGVVTFADNYKRGGLTPTPEIMARRTPAFKRILDELDGDQIVSLVRALYGLAPNDLNWFHDEFSKEDDSFTLVENERETAILAACLLADAIQTGSVGASLGILAAAVDGRRSPIALPDIVNNARTAIAQLALSLRRGSLEHKPFTQRAAGKYAEKADAVATSSDWAKAGELFKFLGEDAFEQTKHSIIQSNTAVSQLSKAMEVLQEEVNVLWWFIGGYSRTLNVPFSTLVPGLAGVIAGLEVAQLSCREIGPVAAPTLIGRLLSQRASQEATLEETIEQFPKEQIAALSLSSNTQSVADLCPVVSAFAKAAEIGAAPAWRAAYAKAANFDPTAKFSAESIAKQAYAEVLFLKWHS